MVRCRSRAMGVPTFATPDRHARVTARLPPSAVLLTERTFEGVRKAGFSLNPPSTTLHCEYAHTGVIEYSWWESVPFVRVSLIGYWVCGGSRNLERYDGSPCNVYNLYGNFKLGSL